MEIDPPVLQVGYGVGKGEQAFAVGRETAQKAIQDLQARQPAAILVFASVRYDLSELLRGVHEVTGEVPLVGATTAGEICNGPQQESVVIIALSSPYLKVRVGVGQGAAQDWRQAVAQAVSSPEIAPFFSPQDSPIWSELSSQGTSVFGLLFSPGNTRGADSPSYEILEELKRLSQGMITFIGGGAADDWRLESNYVLWGRQSYPDSVLVAVFETQLRFGMALAHGFRPGIPRATVTRVRGPEVLELDGRPAAETFSSLYAIPRERLEGKHLTLTTGRPMGILDPYGRYTVNVASFFTPAGGVRFAQPVPEGAVLTVMEADPPNLVAAGQEALRKALWRGSVTDPGLVLVFSCALRTRILGGHLKEEIAGMQQMLPGVPVVGFYSFGEQGLADDGVSRHHNEVIAVLVVGRELSAAAQVARENQRLRQELEQRTADLLTANAEMQQKITERRLAEEALRQSKEKYHDLYKLTLLITDNVPDLIWAKDSEDRFLLVNQAMCDKLLRCESPDQAIGKNDLFFAQQEREAGYQHSFGELCVDSDAVVKESQRPGRFLESGLVRDQYLVLDVHKAPLFDEAGRMIGTVGCGRDITREQETEEALRKSEARYRLLVNQIPAVVFKGYGDWSVDFLDEKVEVLTGYSKEDFDSRRVKWCDLIPPEDFDYAQGVFLEALKGDKSYVREHRLRRKDGEIIWVQCRGQIFCDAQGKIDYISGVSFDITARKRAEEALRESEQRFRDLAENASEWIWEVDARGKFTYCSPVVEKILGYGPEEMLTKHFLDFFTPEDREKLKEAAMEIFAAGRPFREFINRIVKKDGGIAWLSTSGVPLLDSAGNLLGYRGASVDITARRRAEEALRDNERFLASVFESIQDGLSVIDKDLNILRVNRAIERFPHTNPIVGRKCYEVYHGRRAPCEVCPTQRTLRSGEASHDIISNQYPDGRMIYLSIHSFPLLDSTSGEIIGVVESVRDITKQQEAEEALHRSEEQLRQAVKMEAVGRLAGGVAHDFNNVLTAITGYGELLLLNLDDREPARQDVADILQAADRAASLIRQLLAFSRKQVLRPQTLNLNTVVAKLDKMLRRIIGEDIDLVTILHPEPCLVQADPGQMEQVIMNLAVNARDAMPQGGKLTLETAPVYLGDDYVRRHAEIQPGSYIMMAISDTGSGMDAEARSRIFEPFFTTKEQGRGTGLGLSTVYGIVRQSGGFIWVYSEPGQGTTFKIYLPRLDEGADKVTSAPVAETMGRGFETILLVEDETMVRQVTQRILERQGYLILTAADGQEALRLSEQHPGPIHLVLTDVVMPGMSGYELMQRLRVQHPETKALYMSGYTENAIVHHGVLEAGIAFLQKPFKQETLLQRVRETLERA